MTITLDRRHLVNVLSLLAGLGLGWLIWGASENGRYQNAGNGVVLDTKTGDLVDPNTGRTHRESQKAATEAIASWRESKARRALWTIVKETPLGGDLTEQRIKQLLAEQGHPTPSDFELQFARAKRWRDQNGPVAKPSDPLDELINRMKP